MLKNIPTSAEDTGSTPGLGRFHTPGVNWACAPQPLKPECLEPVLRDKRSHSNEKPLLCN